MHRFVASLGIGLILAPLAFRASAGASGGYRAPYFAATTPGSWSRYTVTADGKTESTYTYRRLPDQNGHPQVELRADFTAGQFQGTWSTSRYLLSPDYRIEDDALSYARHTEKLLMQSDKMDKMQELDAATLPNIIAAAIDYASSVKFAGTETIAGRLCDRYTYHYVSKEETTTTYDGEVWMNASVPFGLVKEAASIRMKTGPGSKYSMTLEATGNDAAIERAASEAAPPSKGSVEDMRFTEAYRRGMIELEVRVDPASKRGERLLIAAVNKGEAPLHLTIPAASMMFEAGTPLETLTVRPKKAREIDIAPGETSPEFAADQEGDRRVLEGKFTIVIYEGSPLFAGSVTSGPAEQK